MIIYITNIVDYYVTSMIIQIIFVGAVNNIGKSLFISCQLNDNYVITIIYHYLWAFAAAATLALAAALARAAAIFYYASVCFASLYAFFAVATGSDTVTGKTLAWYVC